MSHGLASAAVEGDERRGTSGRDGLEARTTNDWDGRRMKVWRLEAVMRGDGRMRFLMGCRRVVGFEWRRLVAAPRLR